jgi:hypothetical protein
MQNLLALAGSSAILAGLIHLVIILIILAIVYYLVDWLISLVPRIPAVIRTLVLILFVCIAAYNVVVFLLAIA